MGAGEPGDGVARHEQDGGAGPTRARLVLVALLALATVVTVALMVAEATSSDGPARPAEIDQYLAAWGRGDFAAMASLVVDPPADFVAVHRQMHSALFVRQARFQPGEALLEGDTGTVPVVAQFALGGLGVWQYDLTLHLRRGDGQWLVKWSPATLYPDLRSGMGFARTRVDPVRAPLTDRNGLPLAATTAPLIVGSVGPATAEQAAELGPAFQAGDPVGQSGLHQRFNDVLSGEPSGQVQLVPTTPGLPEVIHDFEGTTPEPLRTTFDPRVQAAAENALAIAAGPSALVAIDPPTGEILAVAHNPEDGANRAISGSYPPGSTFKVVTANALLGAGVDPEVQVDCPPTANGFSNFAGQSFGSITFAEAFYRSCNTSFIIQAGFLDDGALEASAGEFGFNVEYDIGAPSVLGSFPAPEGQADELAGAIGQGRVTASPLHMASVAAAVKDGAWRAPSLVQGPHGPERPDPVPLDAEVAATLQDLMRQVVARPEGSGHAAAILGRDIGGKTGTAEFGPEDPPETHAWFIGFDESLAFAILVEGGGSGGSSAAPLGQRFLAALPLPPPG